eukprot:2764130-Rhodomonas_salina.1
MIFDESSCTSTSTRASKSIEMWSAPHQHACHGFGRWRVRGWGSGLASNSNFASRSIGMWSGPHHVSELSRV